MSRLKPEEALELINRRERQILVHSFLYYQLNDNLITDFTFDAWSKELAELIQEYPEAYRKSVYCDGFRGFDGSSGFDLPYSRPEIQRIGIGLLDYRKCHSEG